MYVLDIPFSDEDMMKVVVNGNPAFSWSGLLGRNEIGNFYKTFSVIPNNVGPTEKLFFKSYFIGGGSTPAEDKQGNTYQATHFHIPLFHCYAAEAGEYVSGFPVDQPNRPLENFGQLVGLQGVTPLGTRFIFSESNVFTTEVPSDKGSDIFTIENEKGALPSDIPSDLLELVNSGHQLFWQRANAKFYPFKIHFLYNSKLYFKETTPIGNIKYRAMYYLEPMRPIDAKDSFSGRGFIVGFGVSHDTGRTLRGFGALNILPTDTVSFEPST